jgi:dsRNA-specific ribonuclease
VSRRRCAEYAQRLGLGPCIRAAIGFRRSDGRPGPEDSMLAEAFEAVLGAVYQV